MYSKWVVFLAKWLENPTGVRKVMNSYPVGEMQIFCLPHAHDNRIYIFLNKTDKDVSVGQRKNLTVCPMHMTTEFTSFSIKLIKM